MKSKRNVGAWILLGIGILFLVNAASEAGFFPSGHGSGRIPEIIMGVAFVICGVAYLISERGKAKAATKLREGAKLEPLNQRQPDVLLEHLKPTLMRVEVSTLRRKRF